MQNTSGKMLPKKFHARCASLCLLYMLCMLWSYGVLHVVHVLFLVHVGIPCIFCCCMLWCYTYCDLIYKYCSFIFCCKNYNCFCLNARRNTRACCVTSTGGWTKMTNDEILFRVLDKKSGYFHRKSTSKKLQVRGQNKIWKSKYRGLLLKWRIQWGKIYIIQECNEDRIWRK